ncbi:MAG: hypothetical protein ABIJ50_04605 [Pseudomonadota bacterium]
MKLSKSPRNIELFERITAITMVRLYEQFPTPLDIKASSIGSEAAYDAKDYKEAFDIIASIAEHSISFLIEEGFLRINQFERKTLTGPEFPGTRLTLKGFTLLGKVPPSIDETVDRRPFVEQLKSAVEDGAKGTLDNVIKSMFSGAIQLGISAINNI